MMSYAIVLLALSVPLLVPLVGGASSEVCELHESLRFESISEYRLAANEIYGKPDSECPAYVKGAAKELEILASTENICTQEKADQIRLFHYKYLVNKRDSLPKPVEKFFVAYALRVSEDCRIFLIRELIKSSTLLLNEDLRRVDKYISKDGLLALVITEPIVDYNDLIPPKTLLDALARTQSKNPNKDKKVYLQTRTVDEIREFQSLCRRKFIPLYEPLILPLATISSLGYNYKGWRTYKRNHEVVKIREATYKWYRLVFLCESLKDIEVIRLEEAVGDDSSESKSLIRILSQEDADKLRRTSPELFKLEELHGPAEIAQMSIQVHIGDQVYSLDDDEFVKAVEDYKVGSNIVARFFGKIASAMKGKLTHEMVKYAFSYQGIELGHTKARSTDEFIRVLDDYVAATHGKFLPRGGWRKAVELLQRTVDFIFAVLLGIAIIDFFCGLSYLLGK